jgi:hypothetical protein
MDGQFIVLLSYELNGFFSPLSRQSVGRSVHTHRSLAGEATISLSLALPDRDVGLEQLANKELS